MASPKPQTKIKKATRKAGIVLSLLFIMIIASTSGTVYAGITSGELDDKVLKPIRYGFNKVIKSINQPAEKTSTPTPTPKDNNQVRTESQEKIKIRTNNNSSSAYSGQQIHWIYPPQVPSYNYETIKRSQEEWWNKIQKQNQQLDENSKKSLEEFKKQSEQRLEEFKLKGEEGMKDFEAEMQKNQEEFLKEHGVTP